ARRHGVAGAGRRRGRGVGLRLRRLGQGAVAAVPDLARPARPARPRPAGTRGLGAASGRAGSHAALVPEPLLVARLRLPHARDDPGRGSRRHAAGAPRSPDVAAAACDRSVTLCSPWIGAPATPTIVWRDNVADRLLSWFFLGVVGGVMPLLAELVLRVALRRPHSLTALV